MSENTLAGPGEYVIPTGKFKGKKLSDLPPDVLREYSAWIAMTLMNKTARNREFFKKAEQYLEGLK